MAQNYIRQSSFSDGDTITASLFNNEYNQLLNAFSYSSSDSAATGHRHDGSTGEGGNIPKIGDLDFLNKIEIDSSNNRWGVYVEVAGVSTEQIRIQDGSIVPVTTNDIDLGSGSLQFKDLFIDGTASIDSLTLSTGSTVTVILDEDNLVTNSDTALATQQSIKAYVDSQITANNELSEILVNGNTTGGTDISVSTGDDITFADSSKAIFGASSDLQIYHTPTGNHSIIAESGAGNLILAADNLEINNAANNANKIVATTGGAVTLFHNNAAKLATTATGIDVTGVITTDGMTTSADINFGDNDKAVFGAGSDLQIYHDGSNSYIVDNGTGDLILQAGNDLILRETDGTTEYLRANEGAGVQIYHNGSQKFLTTSTGIDVTGTVTADGGLIEGSTGLTIRNDAVGANEPKLVFDNDTFAGASYAQIQTGNGGLQLLIESPSTSTFQNRHQLLLNGGGSTDVTFKLSTDNGTSYKNQLQINNNDVSFYEDTGTTAKFFWDASAESLGIGTTSAGDPITPLVINKSDSSAGYIRFTNSDATSGFYIGLTASEDALLNNQEASNMIFHTNNTERMRIDANGNVGIGTDSPAELLNVHENSTNAARMRLSNTDGYLEIGTNNQVSNLDSQTHTFRNEAGSTEYMRIDSSGNVGIGSSTISGILQVTGADTVEGDAKGQIVIKDSAAYNASPTMGFIFQGEHTTGSQAFMASIYGAKENATAGNYAGYLGFATRSQGSTTAERMRIDSAGNVGIGTASPSALLNLSSSSNTVLRLDDTNGTDSYHHIETSGTNGQNLIISADQGGTGGGALIIRNNGGSEAMRITSDGNVGIGTDAIDLTSSGRTVVQIEGSSNALLNLTDGTSRLYLHQKGGTSGADIWNSANSYMRFATNDTERMRIDANGNVGIGAESPTTIATDTSSISLGGTSSTVSGGIAYQINDVVKGYHYVEGNFLIHQTVSGIGQRFWAGGSEAMRIDANGNVGIGTTSPSAKLDVELGTTGIIAEFRGADSDILQINSEENLIALDVRNTTSGLAFQMQGASKMRLTQGGNLLVGKTSTSSAIAGTTLWAGGYINSTVSSDYVARFNRLTSDGEIFQFQKDSLTVGSIGVKISDAASGDGELYVASGNTGLFFDDVNNYIRPANASGALRDNIVDLGKSDSRFKDLYLSGSAKLVADSAASAEIQLNQTGTGGRDYRISSTGSGYGSAGALAFYDATASSERARFDSSGNLLVGTTSYNNDIAGIGLGASNFFYATRSGALVGSFNRLTSDGDIVDFRKDGSTVGSIRSQSGLVTDIILDPRLNNYATGHGIGGTQVSGVPKIIPRDGSGNALDAGIDLGHSNSRFKDLYLSGATKLFSGTNSPATNSTLGDIDFGARTDGTVTAKIRGIAGDNGNGTDGQITFFTADNTASQAAQERMRIDSSGNVGIGIVPDSNSKLHVLDDTSSLDDYVVHIESYTPAIVFHDISATSTDFAIQADNSALMFRYGDASTGTQLASEAMRIDSSGHAIIPAGVTLGTAAGTYNAANTLDDYEEGVFSGTVDGTTYSGEYTKVGNLVTISCYYDCSAATNNRIAIVPFACSGVVSTQNSGAGITASSSATHPEGTSACVFGTTANVYAYSYARATLGTPLTGNGSFQFTYYTTE